MEKAGGSIPPCSTTIRPYRAQAITKFACVFFCLRTGGSERSPQRQVDEGEEDFAAATPKQYLPSQWRARRITTLVKRNTLLVGLIATVAAVVACSATSLAGPAKAAVPPKAAVVPSPPAPPAPPKTQIAVRPPKLAIVVSEIGTSRSAVDIAYPKDADPQQMQTDIAAFAANTGWQPGPIKSQKTPDSVTVHFPVSPGPHIVASQGLPIWPLLLTFRAYTNMEVAYLGIGDVTVNDKFSNRFVDYSVSGSGGIATYNITIKDPSFSSVAEVSAPDKPTATKTVATAAAPGALLWAMLGLVALALGGAAYWASHRLIRARKR